jgi:hypothetical protein
MKKKTGKKPAKKVDRAPDSAPAISDGSMRVLALECWRIKKLIPEFGDNRKNLVLQTCVDKMTDALVALGVAIDDPEGSEFKDGMTLNVAVLITPTLLSPRRGYFKCLNQRAGDGITSEGAVVTSLDARLSNRAAGEGMHNSWQAGRSTGNAVRPAPNAGRRWLLSRCLLACSR